MDLPWVAGSRGGGFATTIHLIAAFETRTHFTKREQGGLLQVYNTRTESSALSSWSSPWWDRTTPSAGGRAFPRRHTAGRPGEVVGKARPIRLLLSDLLLGVPSCVFLRRVNVILCPTGPVDFRLDEIATITVCSSADKGDPTVPRWGGYLL